MTENGNMKRAESSDSIFNFKIVSIGKECRLSGRADQRPRAWQSPERVAATYPHMPSFRCPANSALIIPIVTGQNRGFGQIASRRPGRARPRRRPRLIRASPKAYSIMTCAASWYKETVPQGLPRSQQAFRTSLLTLRIRGTCPGHCPPREYIRMHHISAP